MDKVFLFLHCVLAVCKHEISLSVWSETAWDWGLGPGITQAVRSKKDIVRNIFKLVETRRVETCFLRELRYCNMSRHSLTHSGVDTVRN